VVEQGHNTHFPDNNKKNINNIMLWEVFCSALSKGQNYAVPPAVMLVDDTMCRADKAIGVLPKTAALASNRHDPHKPKCNLTCGEKEPVGP
jgi:hypothetical protein